METVPELHKAKSTFPLHKAYTRSSRVWQSTFLPCNPRTWPRSMRPKLGSAFRCCIQRTLPLMIVLFVWSRCLLHTARRQTRLCCPRLPGTCRRRNRRMWLQPRPPRRRRTCRLRKARTRSSRLWQRTGLDRTARRQTRWCCPRLPGTCQARSQNSESMQ